MEFTHLRSETTNYYLTDKLLRQKITLYIKFNLEINWFIVITFYIFFILTLFIMSLIVIP